MPLMTVTTADLRSACDTYWRDVATLRSFTGMSVSIGAADGCQSRWLTTRACSRLVTAGSGSNVCHRWVTAPWTTAPAAISPAITTSVGVLSMVNLRGERGA